MKYSRNTISNAIVYDATASRLMAGGELQALNAVTTRNT
jgi:hypothetical protein